MNLARRNVMLAVLAAALAVPTTLQLRRDADSFVDISTVPLLFDGFTADQVAFITLAQPKAEQPPLDPNNPQPAKVAYDQLLLQRTDKGFVLGTGVLTGAPVLMERVERDVFAHLRTIRADRDVLVQPNATPEQLAQFGLDELHAFVVRAVDVTQRNVIAELFIGREAGAGQAGSEAVNGVFVRKTDSTDVVLYEFEKGWRRDVLPEQWLDKTIAKLEPDKVQRLSIKNAATAGVKMVFERRDGKASWQAIDAPAGLGAVRQIEVENLVQRLRWIGAQDFRSPLRTAGNPAALGLAPPQIEIELVVKEGDRNRTIQLAVGNKLDDKNEYYLTCNDGAFLMTWPAGTVAQFELDVKAQLFDPPAPAPTKPDEVPKAPDDKKDDKKGGE